MAQHIFADMKIAVLADGAGETIELVARHLRQAGVEHLTLASYWRAQTLAQEFHAEAVLLEDIPVVLPDADIVI